MPQTAAEVRHPSTFVRHARLPRCRNLAVLVAAAEAIRAGDAGGGRAALLGVGLLVGIAGRWLKIPTSAFGVALIGNLWALTMFGIGLLIRGYAIPVAGIEAGR